MSLAVTATTIVKRGALDASIAQSLTFEGWTEREVTIAAGAVNTEVSLVFTTALLKYLYIHTNKTLTMKTNSTSSPGDTKTLTADIPHVWQVNSGVTVPYAADVTKIYLSNAGADDATVIIRVGTDATP